jgi:hypothetical protein
MKTIRKYLVVVLGVVVLAVFPGVLATSCVVQSEVPTITTSVAGNNVYLTAATPTHGSYYCVDSWDGATEISTMLDRYGNYVSKAIFTSTRSGNFLVTYEITMFGKSGELWTGTASVGLEVTVDSEGRLLIKAVRCELK